MIIILQYMIFILYHKIIYLLYIIIIILQPYLDIYHIVFILFSIIFTIYNANCSLLLLNELSQLQIYRLVISTTKLLPEPSIIVFKLERINRRIVYWKYRSENLFNIISDLMINQQFTSTQGNCLLNRNLLQSNMRIRELLRTNYREPRYKAWFCPELFILAQRQHLLCSCIVRRMQSFGQRRKEQNYYRRSHGA